MIRFAVAAALLLAAAPAYASDETDIVAAIAKMNDAMNKNDAKTAAATYTANATIIDEFPPHYWSGANVFDSWNNDFAVVAKAQGDTDPVVTLAKPTHVSASGDHGTGRLHLQGARQEEDGARPLDVRHAEIRRRVEDRRLELGAALRRRHNASRRRWQMHSSMSASFSALSSA
jgi:ketosteroid isomerase-like protein